MAAQRKKSRPSAALTRRRRSFAATAVLVGVLGVLVVKLVDIQIVNASEHEFNSAQVGNLATTRTLPGERGDIIDTNGFVLAESVTVYEVALDPSLIGAFEKDSENSPVTLDWTEASERIAQILDLNVAELRQSVAERYTENPYSQWLKIASDATAAQFLELRDLKLNYLSGTPLPKRTYPAGAVAGNVVGFVNADGPLEGLEFAENECLAPIDGEESYMRSIDGIRLPNSERVTPAVPGGTLTLTIDSQLNWFLQQMLAEEVAAQMARRGSAIVIEVKTGKIRAAAEYPTVDPNEPWAVDAEDRGSRLFTSTFEPGSTFKAVTAATLLEERVADPLTWVWAADREEFANGAVVGDSSWHEPLAYTLNGALVDSSNVALSKFGDMVSPEVRYDYLKKFGVGTATGVGFPGEEPGIVHEPAAWDGQTHYATTFGQGFTVTAAQLASAYQMIANGGEKMPLTLVESCTHADGTVSDIPPAEGERIISQKNAQDLVRMLENVAVQSFVADGIAVPGYRIAAKTGTAQKPDLENGGYKPGLYYTTLAGFAPAEDPQYVVVVMLDEPTRVTSSAATQSAFQKAMTHVLKSQKVAPSTKPMDALLPITH